MEAVVHRVSTARRRRSSPQSTSRTVVAAAAARAAAPVEAAARAAAPVEVVRVLTPHHRQAACLRAAVSSTSTLRRSSTREPSRGRANSTRSSFQKASFASTRRIGRTQSSRAAAHQQRCHRTHTLPPPAAHRYYLEDATGDASIAELWVQTISFMQARAVPPSARGAMPLDSERDD